MTVNPTTLNLHNSGSNTPTSSTVTVTFTNGPNASFSAAQYNLLQLVLSPNVTVTTSGNTVTIASVAGAGNRGSFTVRVTPSNCGSAAAQNITVNVAK